MNKEERPNWDHIVIEGFCLRGLSCNKDEYHYKVVDFGDDNTDWKTERIKNPCYDPDYKEPEIPEYCKNKVCYTCLVNNCPHFGYSECEEDEEEEIMGFIYDMYEDD